MQYQILGGLVGGLHSFGFFLLFGINRDERFKFFIDLRLGINQILNRNKMHPCEQRYLIDNQLHIIFDHSLA
jgi:hypothetical protein